MSSPAQLSAHVGQVVIALCVIAIAFFALRIVTGLLLAALARIPGFHRDIAARAALRVMPRVLRGALAASLALSGGIAGAGSAAAAAAPAAVGAQMPARQSVAGLPTLDRVPVWEADPVAAQADQRTSEQRASMDKAPERNPASADKSRSPGTQRTVVVKQGDSLWSIARTHLGPGASDADVAAQWPLWWESNRAVIGSDPSVIHPGQVLAVPAKAKG